MAPRTSVGVWAQRVAGTLLGLLPHAIVVSRVGWGPIGNDSIGEWYFLLAFLGACPALGSALTAAILLQIESVRDVGVGLMMSVAAVLLAWMIGVIAYSVGILPPGMAEVPRLR